MSPRSSAPTENPYTNRKAITDPDDFFGRDEELRRLYQYVVTGQSILVEGERRIGKSSLLNAVTFEYQRRAFGVPEEHCFAFVDLQFLAECTIEQLLRHLISRIADASRLTLPDPGDETTFQRDPAQEVRRVLDATAKELLHRGRALTVLFDEVEHLVFNKRIPGWVYEILRSWASQFSVSFVLVSREGSIDPILRADSTGSAFLNIFTRLYVGPLREQEAEQLIREPADRANLPFSIAECEAIKRLAGNHPFFLQMACYYAFQDKLAGRTDERFWERLEEAFIYDASPHLNYLLDGLPAGEQKALRLAAEGKAIKDAQARSGLLKKGLLVPSGGDVRIFSTVLPEMVMSKWP